MAADLAALGIHATLIADSAVFAMMARVNKARGLPVEWLERSVSCRLQAARSQVPSTTRRLALTALLCPTAPRPKHERLQVVATAQALLANGGVMAPVGTHIVAMAAKRHSVPFVVLCGIYKLSTLFPHNPCEPRGRGLPLLLLVA